MNKECIIVNFYPNDFNKVKTLHDCLLSLKDLEKDIFLVSHFPIDKEIQSLCKYCIFDSENELISTQESLEYNLVKQSSNFYRDLSSGNNYDISFINLYSKIYTVAILKSLHTVYSLAQSLGYNYAHFFVGDMIINKKDINNFLNISNQTITNNKKAYFEHTPVDDNKKYTGVECFYWFSEISWFITNFLQITNKIDFLNHIKNTDNTYLEIYFYNILKNLLEDEYILYNKNPKDNVISFSVSDKLGLSFNDNDILSSIIWDEKNNQWLLFLQNLTAFNIEVFNTIFNGHTSEEHSYSLQPWWRNIKPISIPINNILHLKTFINKKQIYCISLENELMDKYKQITSEWVR
jgi:hypothetical protein